MAAVVLRFFGDKFLGTECTLEAETSVSNLTQYKLFIGVDKKMLSGVTFSFNSGASACEGRQRSTMGK